MFGLTITQSVEMRVWKEKTLVMKIVISYHHTDLEATRTIADERRPEGVKTSVWKRVGLQTRPLYIVMLKQKMT